MVSLFLSSFLSGGVRQSDGSPGRPLVAAVHGHASLPLSLWLGCPLLRWRGNETAARRRCSVLSEVVPRCLQLEGKKMMKMHLQILSEKSFLRTPKIIARLSMQLGEMASSLQTHKQPYNLRLGFSTADKNSLIFAPIDFASKKCRDTGAGISNETGPNRSGSFGLGKRKERRSVFVNSLKAFMPRID